MDTVAVILVGGPTKGTRLRPLSLDLPKSLVSMSGKTLIEHQIDGLSKLEGLERVYIVGNHENFTTFSLETKRRLNISYVNEKSRQGTAGALLFLLKSGYLEGCKTLVVTHGDIACDYPYREMLKFYGQIDRGTHTVNVVLSVPVPADVSSNFGCMVSDANTHQVLHYVEKPTSFSSTHINGGIAVYSLSTLQEASRLSRRARDMGTDVYPLLVAGRALYAFIFDKKWCSVKSPDGVLHANRLFLSLLPADAQRTSRVSESATVDPEASLDDSSYVAPECVLKAGVRVVNSVILAGSLVMENCYIKDAIIGPNCVIEPWCRIEGQHTANHFDYFRSIGRNNSYFTAEGKFSPTVAVLGANVHVHRTLLLYKSVVLPHKEIFASVRQEIIL